MSYTNKRRSVRCTFVLTAEVTDEQSRTLIARLRDLNLNGCYVELGNTLPEGAPITIKVAAGKALFEARCKVIYSDILRGSGLNSREWSRFLKASWSRGCQKQKM